MYTRVPPYPLSVNSEIKTDSLGGYADVQKKTRPYGPRETLLTSDMGVLPLDETASARQLKFSALSGLETSQPRPVMAGPPETEARRGMKLTYHWDKGFPRRREAPRTPRGQ